MSDNQDKFSRLLVRTIICSLVATICALVLTSQFVQDFEFNSDQLTVPSFADDLLRNPHFSFFTWMYPRAPYAFPDFPIFLTLRYLTNDVALSVFIHSAIYVLALCVGAKLILDLAVEGEKRRFALIVFLALCIISLLFGSITNSCKLLLWQFIPISHATAAVVSLYLFCFYVRILSRGSVALHFIFVVLCTLSIFSDKIFLLYFCLPMGVTLLASGYRTRRLPCVAVYSTEILIALVLVFIADHLIVLQRIDPIVLDWKRIETIQAVIKSTPLPWLFCLVALFCAIRNCFSDKIGNRSEHDAWQSRSVRYFLVAFTWGGAALTLGLWREPDPAFGRYAVAMTIGGMLSFSIAISELPRRALNYGYLATLAGIVILFTIAIPHLISPLRILTERSEVAASLEACRSKFGLETGFANYWIARKFSVLANWSPQINQFEPGYPRPFFWGNNYLWFYEDLATGRPSDVNFIVMNGLERADIEKSYGHATREVDCGPFHIFIYEDSKSLRSSILDRLSEYKIVYNSRWNVASLSKSSGPRISISSMEIQTGARNGKFISATAPKDGPGFLMFGPYIDLAPGNYSAGFTILCREGQRPNSLDVTVNSGQTVLASAILSSGNSTCDGAVRLIELPLKIVRPVTQLEMRAFFSGTGSLEVQNISLKRLSER